MEHRAFLSIGANLGDRLATCLMALDMLQATDGLEVISRSSAYETDPVGFLEQPSFVNMAAGVVTSLEPMQLLVTLKEIEKKAGRRPGLRWGPRVLDLDIVLYDDLVLHEPTLSIPHKRMHERAFVLVPLSEIAPEIMHPGLKKSVKVLLSDLGEEPGGVRKLDDPVNNA